MPNFIVTMTSPVIEADTADDAIQYADSHGSNHWEATLLDEQPPKLTIYYVGTNEQDALTGMPFDAAESAQDFLFDQENSDELHIYSVYATVDVSSIALSD